MAYNEVQWTWAERISTETQLETTTVSLFSSKRKSGPKLSTSWLCVDWLVSNHIEHIHAYTYNVSVCVCVWVCVIFITDTSTCYCCSAPLGRTGRRQSRPGEEWRVRLSYGGHAVCFLSQALVRLTARSLIINLTLTPEWSHR